MPTIRPFFYCPISMGHKERKKRPSSSALYAALKQRNKIWWNYTLSFILNFTFRFAILMFQTKGSSLWFFRTFVVDVVTVGAVVVAVVVVAILFVNICITNKIFFVQMTFQLSSFQPFCSAKNSTVSTKVDTKTF